MTMFKNLSNAPLEKLTANGHAIDNDAVGDLSPYQTEHLNRFGTYAVNMNRVPEPLNFELP